MTSLILLLVLSAQAAITPGTSRQPAAGSVTEASLSFDPATQSELNTSASEKVTKTGDTMSGLLTVPQIRYSFDNAVQTGASPWVRDSTGNVISPVVSTAAVMIPSTLTVAGAAFSVGTSTLSVRSGRVGIGTTNPNNLLQVAGLLNFDQANANNALGALALSSLTSGVSDTAMGHSALISNTGGSRNTAMGATALSGNLTGDDNTAVGSSAMNFANSASKNSALGSGALNAANTGGNNTAMGYHALNGNTSGAANTAIGMETLKANLTASNNTALGYQAGLSITTGTGNVFLGYQAGSAELYGSSNKLFIDNSSASNPLIYGDFSTDSVGIATATTAGMFVVGAGTLTVTAAGRVGVNNATPTAALDVTGSVKISSMAIVGYERVVNNCGAGVTVCTASCAASSVILGGGCDAGVGLSKAFPPTGATWECTALTATTIISYALCARLGN